MEANISGFVNRFIRLRSLLNCQTPMILPIISCPIPISHCNEDAVRRQILADNNILLKRVNELDTSIFNREYLLTISRQLVYDPVIQIITEVSSVETFRDFENRFREEPAWQYVKCLMRIIQSNPDLRIEDEEEDELDENLRIVSDYELGTYNQDLLIGCNVNGIRRVINENGVDLLDKTPRELEAEFGRFFFNAEYLSQIYNEFHPFPQLIHIIASTSKHQADLESRLSGPAWEYVKCLINIFTGITEINIQVQSVINQIF